MYFIFDTETTGLPSKFHGPSSTNQARVMQIAALVLDDKFKPIAELATLIKPSTWNKVDPGAFKAHGITVERCIKEGAGMHNVLNILSAWASSCRVLIAHNIKFDQQMLDIECDHFGVPRIIKHDVINSLFCTMLHTTEICKIPHPTWQGRSKWPKVKEAYKHFTGTEPDNQHDALGDVRATAIIFEHLHKLGIVQQALAL